MNLIPKIISGILATVCPINLMQSSNTVSINEMKEYLSNAGVPQIYIDYMPNETIEKQYNEYINNFIVYAGTETADLSIGDTTQSNTLSGVIKETDMTLSLTKALEYKSYDSTVINKVKIWVEYNYLNMPVVQKSDAVICNWDASVFSYLADSFDSVALVNTVRSTSFKLAEHSLHYPTELVQGGLGYTVDLSGYFLYTTIQLQGVAYFELIPKNNPTYDVASSDTDYSTTVINAQYRHNGNPFAGSVGLSSNGVSISFNLDSLTYTTARATNIYYKLN